MADLAWPCALVVVAALCWDAWRRWLVRSVVDWNRRIAEVEATSQALRTEVGDLRATIGKHALAGTVGGMPMSRRIVR